MRVSRLARFLLWILPAVLLVGAGCRSPVPTPTPSPVPPSPTPVAQEPPLYVAIFWHQHQPLYFKDPETGVYEKPWVRVHAAKDYVDMAAMLEQYPDIRVTFNLTPSLLRQIIDISEGAKDLYWVHTEIPADQLTEEQKAFIQARFFDINPKIVARFPRYQEIAADRANWRNWDTQTWRDLQVLFNLAWTDPDWLAQEPLKSLVDRGRDFTEEDKQVVLQEHLRLVREVIPVHRRLLERGQIEITTTPFYHPILPLLVDTNLARVAAPGGIDLPPRFTYPQDAVAQLEKSVAFYEELFGRKPRGLWPAEGAVAQAIIPMVAQAGFVWMASDEEVLARSLGKPTIVRDTQGNVREPQVLYRPYIAHTSDWQVYVVFRDKVLSDKVGFTYSGVPGDVAAKDFVRRLLRARETLLEQGAEGPFLLSVILDGENAWEHYPNDGKEFLHTMYTLLEEEQRKGTLRTITPTEFVARFPDQPPLKRLWPGSWVAPNYLTWIGEEEENRAWAYLKRVRDFVAEQEGEVPPERLKQAMEHIYAAEGSDWFWWYGADQNSGDDEAFDRQFRRTLQQVYVALGAPIPTFLQVPVIPQVPVSPEVSATGTITPTVDGVAGEEEWEAAGYFPVEPEAPPAPEPVVETFWYGFDAKHLYLRLDARRPWADLGPGARVEFYVKQPKAPAANFFPRDSEAGAEVLLGFGASALAEVTLDENVSAATFFVAEGESAWKQVADNLPAGISEKTLEVAVPFELLGKPEEGDQYLMRAVVRDGSGRLVQFAPSRPALVLVPDLGLVKPILLVQDPQGDDHGPGTYTYPLDPVFSPGAYDLREFFVGEDENNLIFRFTFFGDLNNDWGAPNGMGIHALDVYIDAQEGGARLLLPGRNAAVPPGDEWDVAVWAEGWTPGIFAPPSSAGEEPSKVGGASAFIIVTDPAQRRITIRVPKEVLAKALKIPASELKPREWKYLAVVLSQEGFPAAGVWRVRDVEPKAAQWRLGGGPDDVNHTRILDVAYPEGFTPTQEEALSTYPPAKEGSADELTPDDFAQLPMLRSSNQ